MPAMVGQPTRALAVAGLLLIALLCASCGSTGKASTAAGASGAEASAKANFVAQAQHICSTLSTQEKPLKARQEALKGLSATAAAQAFVALVRQLVAFSHAASAKLKLIPEPPGDAGAIHQLLSGFAQETSAATALATAASKQESNTGETVQDALRSSIAHNRAAAQRYGMSQCIGAE
jgi:hypothetical protein